MSLEVNFYKKNLLYKGKKYDSPIIGGKIIEFRNAYFALKYFDNFKFDDFIEVSKEQFKSILDLLKEWSVSLVSKDFSSVSYKVTKWYGLNYDDEKLINILKSYIEKMEEIYCDFDWTEDKMVVYCEKTYGNKYF